MSRIFTIEDTGDRAGWEPRIVVTRIANFYVPRQDKVRSFDWPEDGDDALQAELDYWGADRKTVEPQWHVTLETAYEEHDGSKGYEALDEDWSYDEAEALALAESWQRQGLDLLARLFPRRYGRGAS